MRKLVVLAISCCTLLVSAMAAQEAGPAHVFRAGAAIGNITPFFGTPTISLRAEPSA